ncbi:MAG TPA: glycosyltransferase family 4 protein [Candidatus Omnitrophota bacterium]|nr:glycosyltransferase family 4 protein [Candidatus Omnitrophota bacterium]
MAKKKLLYVITKLELGGAQTQLLSLIRGLDRSKYDIFLFTARTGMLMDDALAVTGLRVHRSRFLERAVNPFLDIPAFFELVGFMRRKKIDIVHTHSSKAGIIGRFAARAAGIRFVHHTVHGWSFHRFQNAAVRSLYMFLERCAGSWTTNIIVVSEFDRRRGVECKIAAPERYVLIRYGIDIGAFAAARPGARSLPGIPPAALVVGMTACFKPQKAVRDFIEVARDICASGTDAVFVIAGDGAERPAVERLIAASGLQGRVKLLGWRRDMAGVVKSFDVFMLTSLWEGMPIAVIEAMAASRPVIVTDTGGIRDLVRDGENGFIVRPGDTRAMAQKLRSLLRDGGMREAAGKIAAASLNEDYTTRRMVEETSRVYDTPAAGAA